MLRRCDSYGCATGNVNPALRTLKLLHFERASLMAAFLLLLVVAAIAIAVPGLFTALIGGVIAYFILQALGAIICGCE